MQGLLRFAMLATAAEDAPGNSNFAPMDEEVFYNIIYPVTCKKKTK